jgi:sulfate permease, SulP family
MSENTRTRLSPAFSDLFVPKLVTIWREGYGAAAFKADALAGLTVAIVALPLSMAIAIASGAKPEQGLYAAIVGGGIVSALGGSRFQIGGPAGAFIVLVATTINSYGMDGFLAATMMAGVLLLAIGYLRLGVYIKYIPHPVIVGFTAGIAVIILASQLREFLGLNMTHEPAAFLPKLKALAAALPSFNAAALAVALATLAVILVLRRAAPRFPGLLAAIALAAFCTWFFNLPVETIASRYGGIPHGLPAPALPAVSPARLLELVPSAIALAMLGGIESLLSAVVADGMTGRRHRSNCELVAQGYANIASALFGGLCVTGNIARTATNVRAHAHGPVSGILHAAFLLAIMLLAAPLAGAIPLAALSAVLVVVAWNMADKSEFIATLKADRGDAAVLLATFLLTVFRDLTEGIAVGVTLGAILFMHRMAEMVEVTTHAHLLTDDEADDANSGRGVYREDTDPDIIVYRIAGPFFFGAAAAVSGALQRIGQTPKTFILDLTAVPLIDKAGTHELASFVARARKAGAQVFLAGAAARVRLALKANGFDGRGVRFAPSVGAARSRASIDGQLRRGRT